MTGECVEVKGRLPDNADLQRVCQAMKITTREFTAPDGLTLVADCRGDPDGPPVLFCHGGGQTRHAWARAAEALARRGWYAVCYDHRGHGDSGWDPSGVYRFESFCDDLAAVARQLGGSPHIVGASLGGVAALVALGESGLAASSLVLVDVTPRLNRAGVDGIQVFMERNAEEGFASLEEAADAIAAYTGRPRRQDVSGLKKNLRLRDGRWYWHWDPKMLTLHEADLGAREIRFERALVNVDVPLMLVRGSASDVVTEEEARAFRQLAPAADYVDVAQARHMVAGDRNDAFTVAVERFLERVGPG